jgi:hypothetical protein
MIVIGRELRVGEKAKSIGFVGFHESFNPVWNHITIALKHEFPMIVADIAAGEVPDYLFFSVFDSPHRDPKYDRCIKIFTCEENIRVPWHDCDYAMSSDRFTRHPFYLRLPIYVRFLQHLKDHTKRTLIKDKETPITKKPKFCNFVYSNKSASERILFFEMLSKYKRVDSGGSVANNMGGVRVADKMKFLEDYKFTIAFENSRYPGYVSEKIVEPMAAGSIPIYWGCRHIGEDFNPFSFVNANEPKGADTNELVFHFEQVIRKIIWLDTHDDDYEAMLAEPWFHKNVPNEYCQPTYLCSFMEQVFTTPKWSLPKRPAAPPPPPAPPAPPLPPSPPAPPPRGWSWADHLPPTKRAPNVKK